VLSAASSRTVTNCASTIHAKDRWEYDQLAAGTVSAGFLTSHTVERRDDTGTVLATLRTFDAIYDATGNLASVTTTREDGATRTVTATYDPFGLAPLSTTTSATGVPALQTTIIRDPITLTVLSVTDRNGTQHGTTFDGFDREILSTITPPNGTPGALSHVSYLGFTGSDPNGRRIIHKVFTDPVNPAIAGTATGRTGTVFLDELGRQRHTEFDLGADYQNQLLIAGRRTYDGLGRLVFEADPHPSTEGFATAYGTTQFFQADGTPSCVVRGKGLQTTVPTATHEGEELYPTCIQRVFQSHTQVVSVRDAASFLASSPQSGVMKSSYTTAVGRLLGRSTWQGSARLEHATFSHDRLGHLTGMTRYQDASAGANPVTSSWRYDSLGQLLELHEPDSVPQHYTYSHWGELLQMHRTPSSNTTLRTVNTYDALGRVIHSEQRNGNSVIAETVNDYFYDQAVNVAPNVTPTHLLGRLALATSPTGSESFSYDAFGRINARVFTDNEGALYIEKHAFHGDGTPQALDFLLPDAAFDPEHVAYHYDSAGRGTRVEYTKSGSTQKLFEASTIDPFGRIRQAKYGATSYSASYADVGRRLMNQVTLSSPAGSRSISYQGYDPVGRERSRLEARSGVATGATTTWSYDALGRLSSAIQTRGATTVFNQQFSYDPLGNIVNLSNIAGDSGTTSTTLSYLATDRDRICRIRHGADTGTACNVTYDDVGSIVVQATPTGSRQYSYFADGSIRTITDTLGSAAGFRYDAFGRIQELDVTSSVSTDTRRDRRYGELLAWRDATINGSPASVLSRKVPGPDGFLATRRGAGGPWVFEFGEMRGNRFFTDESGAFVQDVDYQPYGKATSTGAQPGSLLYSSEQWNQGDLLEAFGISQLGARLYDPAIGRFLSRDPLLIPRTAATTNPYAFADNDPVNLSDPTGLCTSGAKTLVDTGEPCVNEDGNKGGTGGSAAGLWVHLGGEPREYQGSGSGGGRSPAHDSAGASNSQTLVHPSFFQVVNGVPLYYHGDGTIVFPRIYGPSADPGLETFVGVRIPSNSSSRQLAPRQYYKNHIAAQDAANGRIHLAEIAEAGHGCAYCHVQHNLNRKPTDAELDMFRYGTVAGLMGGGRMAAQAIPFFPASPGLRVGSGESSASPPATIVRVIGRGEKVADIVAEGKALTFTTGNEHALLRLSNGQRVIVSGGPGGIDLSGLKIRRIIGHSHPYHRQSAGPSADDFDALRKLGQPSSYLLERGTLTRFRVK
jgi:RHS repeat-associated protein